MEKTNYEASTRRLGLRRLLLPWICLVIVGTTNVSFAQELADLTMGAVNGPASGLLGAQITVSDTVTASQSGGISVPFHVGIYLSSDSAITSSDILLGERVVSSLAAGASDTSATNVTIPADLAPGIYYTGAIADIYNDIVESDETNNSRVGNQITIDLISINPVITPTKQTSQTITGSMASGATAAVTVDTTATAGAVTYPTATTWSCTITGLVEGANSITVTATDGAGKTSTATTSITVYHLSITNVSSSTNKIDTSALESVTIFYTLNSSATATLKVIPEAQGPTGVPVYETSKTCAEAGAYFFTWDGKNNAGTVAPDGAYLYVIEATDGVDSATYSPPPPSGSSSVSCTYDTYDAVKNDPLVIQYSLAKPARFDISISWGGETFKVADGLPDVAGSNFYEWDGRNPVGMILSGTPRVDCKQTSLLPENHVITTGDTPRITAFRTDPYRMQLAYGEFSRITYKLSRDADVTVTLLSPTGGTLPLLSKQSLMAGEHEIEWTGIDRADPTAIKFLVSSEGNYTVQIEAVNAATSSKATAKANLQISY